MSSEACPIELSDDSSNGSTSNTSVNKSQAPSQPAAQPVKKNIAVKRGAPQPPVIQRHIRDLQVLNSSSVFLDNFNPLTSRREKNKRKHFVGPKTQTKKTYYTCLYDEQGRLKSTNEDVCDCFDLTCAGCHFECYTCGSQKCALRCRNNRRFMYEAIEFDGKDTVLTNPLLTKTT